METTKKSQSSAQPKKSLEWGDHNAKLTDHNFIDRKHKKISNQNQSLSNTNAPVNPEDEESRRDRKGVKEGESPLDTNRGKAF